jgi:hypothetical protein
MKLTKFELRVARTIMCAVFPVGADPRITEPIADMDLESFARYATGDVPFKPALGFRAVIWMTLFAPLFVLGRFRTFLGISEDDRDRVVNALISSKIYEIRALFVFFKAYTSLYYFTNARVREQVTESLAHSGERPKALAQIRTKQEVRHAS